LVTTDIARAVFEADVVMCVTPSQYLREVFGHIAPVLDPEQIVVSATKGLEEGSLLRMSQVLTSMTRCPVAVLSGPSFAQEVAAGIPTAIVAASTVSGVAQTVQREFGSSTLRLYTNDDMAGVELGGAVKNVVALAAGVVNGRELGYNCGAGLIRGGIADSTRLAG